MRLTQLARSPSEHLLKSGGAERLAAKLPVTDQSPALVLHAHCHARASKAADADAELARRLGFTVQALDAGCCGLAGSFGFRAEHEGLSRRIGLETWLPAIRDALDGQPNDARLVVDGFSCATQLKHLGDIPASGILSVLRSELERSVTGAESRIGQDVARLSARS